MTPSHGEPQNRANQGQYRSNDDATAYPQSGAYPDSGSSRTLSDPEPAHTIARQDSSIFSNCPTRGIKRTQNDYAENAIQQAADATAMVHGDGRQLMPPPRLPHRRKQATPQKAVAGSQMRNSQEHAQQLSTHPRHEGSEYYTMGGALRPESRIENGKISNFFVNLYPHQTRVVSTSWHQQGGLENTSLRQPLGSHNPTNGQYAQSLASRHSVPTILSSSEPEHLRNTTSLPIRAESRTSAHRPQNSIVPTTRTQSATPGRPFREESQSGGPLTRFRTGVPCTPILSHAELVVQPSTQSGRATTRFRNGVSYTPLLSRAELVRPPQAQSFVSHFFSVPATPSAYHTTNSGYNTHGGSLSARSSTNESFRMEPNEGNWNPHRSLNSLSFISNPYTSNFEPIGGQFSGGAGLDNRLSSSIISSRMGGIGRRSVRR